MSSVQSVSECMGTSWSDMGVGAVLMAGWSDHIFGDGSRKFGRKFQLSHGWCSSGQV